MHTVMKVPEFWSLLPQDTRRYETNTDLGYYLEPSYDWYEFCTKRQGFYESVGNPEAALVYWAMRYMDVDDPCTEEGWKDLCDYWSYKLGG